MSRVVIRDQVNVLVLRGLAVDEPEKLEPLLMPVLRHTSPYHCPVQRIESCEQRRRPVALVVVGHGASMAWDEGKARLGSVECLNLTLLIHRQHQSVLWRIQIKADDIVQFLDKLRIVAQLEGTRQMRLQAVPSPLSTNRSRAQSHHLGKAAGAPMSSPLRGLLGRLANNLTNYFLADPALSSRPRGIFQDAGDPLLGKAAAPKASRLARDTAESRDFLVLLALSREQDDSRSLPHARRDLPAPRQSLQLGSLL